MTAIYTNELNNLIESVSQVKQGPPLTIKSENENIVLQPSPIPFWKKYSNYLIYTVVPVIIFIIFYLLKPTVMMKENEDHTFSIIWSKMIIWSIVVSIPLIVGIYIFINKKKTTN